MTKNNLEDHLSWLLRTRPFIPTAVGLLAESRLSPGDSQGTLDRSTPARSPKNTQSAIISPTIGALRRANLVEGFAKPNLSRLPSQESSTDSNSPQEPCDSSTMVRLQSAPRSASTPRLLTGLPAARAPKEHLSRNQATPVSIANNAPTSLRDRYSAHCRRVGDSQDTPSARRSKPSRSRRGEQFPRQLPTETRTPIAPRTVVCPPTVESVDLTGDDVQTSPVTIEVFGRPKTIWREDSASREEPLPNKGKKRKSDEYNADHTPRTPESGTKRGRVEVEVRLHSSPFVTIDAYPDEAPPPYSTTSHPSQSQQSKCSSVGHSQSTPRDDEFEEHIVTETRTRTELRRKRKPVSRTLSGSGEAFDLQDCEMEGNTVEQVATADIVTTKPAMSRNPELPQLLASGDSKSPCASGLARTRRKRIIPNSDEEDEEDEEDDYGMKSDFWEDVGKHSSEASGPKGSSSTKPDSPTKGKWARSSGELQFEGIKNSTSESREGATYPLSSGAAVPDQGGKNSQASPFQCDSPTRFTKTDTQRSVMTITQQVLAQPLSETREYQRRLQESLEVKKQQAIGFLRDGNSLPASLTEERKLLMKQSEGMASIVSLKMEYVGLTNLQHKLGDKLLEAYDEGYDLSKLQKELNQTSLSLEQKEGQIATVLRNAELASFLVTDTTSFHPKTFNSRTETQPDMVVQSTQVPAASSRKTAMPQPSGLSPTQIVQQTQVTQMWRSTPYKRPVLEKFNPPQLPPMQKTIHLSRFGEPTSQALLQASSTPPNPTEITTYLSPKKEAEPKPVTNPTDPVQENRLKRPLGSLQDSGPSQQVGDQKDVETSVSGHGGRTHVDNWGSEEHGSYSRTMAASAEDDDDQYGSENDEDFLEAETSLALDRSRSKNREVFAETSGNLVSHSHLDRPQSSKSGAPPTPTAPPISMHHRWSNDVKAAMKDRFHLRGFRQHQLEAINATLAGVDAFVLMPTGGGKSLCYQLPSIINSGKTRGVTVVISPLLSLMQDQVDHLRKLNIQAFLFNGEVTKEHRALIMQGLRDPNVEQLIQLLYVTPEMVTKSQALVNAFLALHSCQKLARIVIDEAHCVSQWGHDFRPDYKAIGEVRQRFKGVPVMALTATATENVKVDVIHNLSIQGCKVFTQSFNRPNLTYEVRAKAKEKDVLDSIANTIRGSYMGESGIIYCLSRQNCEKVAEKLRQSYGIKAHHYHAGMEAAQKIFVQKEWQAGRYNVIVATIAFGMGIDKPDVRFVIHHTIPKSLEGYYQETGRAGRDGKRSGCYLYYGYRDTSTLRRMIEEGEGSWEQKDRQQKMLRNVVHFCENKVDCRRVQVLAYFNEPFQRENCNGNCDNCSSSSVFENRDFTKYAILAVNLVERLEGKNVTLLHCVDIFRGGKAKKIANVDHSSFAEYGSGSNLERGEAERLFYRLLTEGALEEHNVVNKSGFASQYIRLGRNSRQFAFGGRKLRIQVRVSPTDEDNTASKAKGKTAPKPAKKPVKSGTGVVGATLSEFPQSTNVSSPVQQVTRRHRARERSSGNDLPLLPSGYLHDGFVVPDGKCSSSQEDTDDTETFKPVRVKGIAVKSSKRVLSTPITTDQEMAVLDPIHRDIVEQFLILAKKESEEIRNSKNLRSQPFSDNVLRRMAIKFPKDEEEMLRIQGIEPDKVHRYGKKFLKLIRNHHSQYQSIMTHSQDTRFDKPEDPNHEIITIITSDEEDNSDGGDPVEENSPYFTAEVEAFNSQFAQYANLPAPTDPTSRDGGSRGGARGKFRGNGVARRKISRTSSRSGSLATKSKGGIKKPTGTSGKRTSSGSWSNASAFTAKGRGPSKRGDGGNSGGKSRGIGMMPI